jgi:hypothetical protein
MLQHSTSFEFVMMPFDLIDSLALAALSGGLSSSFSTKLRLAIGFKLHFHRINLFGNCLEFHPLINLVEILKR